MNEYCGFCGNPLEETDEFFCRSCRTRDRVELIIYGIGCAVALAAAFAIAAIGPTLVMGWMS